VHDVVDSIEEIVDLVLDDELTRFVDSGDTDALGSLLEGLCFLDDLLHLLDLLHILLRYNKFRQTHSAH